MEQVYQFGVAYRRAGKYSDQQLILISNSNAISGASGATFATLPVVVKEFLGIKKVLIE